jgi:cell division protein FtsW
VLVGAGLVMVYSASAGQTGARQSSYLYRQAISAVAGLVGLLVVMRIDYRQFRRPPVIWSLLAVSVVLLLGVFFFDPVNGARRWIPFGLTSFQPSELAKLTAVIFTAAVLERRMHRINELAYALLPIGLMALTLVGLVLLEPDFGTSAVIILAIVAMVFAAGFQYRYLLVTVALLLVGSAAYIGAKEYRIQRVLTFLDPWRDRQGKGYQVVQSLIAVGSGGLAGKGLMRGIQKLYYLPEPQTDFVYAVVAEELGLVGATLVLMCFAVMAWRGLRIALLAPDRFGSLLALGLTTVIAIQGLMNISVVTALIPNKGIPLPFVSSGGSSLVISMVAMGILLNISQHATQSAGAVLPGRTGWTLGEQEA